MPFKDEGDTMLKYIIKRLLWMIPVVLGVLVIVFTISYFMPGDPVVTVLGTDYTQEQYEQTEHELGLDQPYLVQLANYIWGVVTEFDLGTSYATNNAVTFMIKTRIWTTVKIGLMSCCLTIILGIPLGILAAIKQNTVVDYSLSTFAIVLASLPGFWLALMGILLFSLKLRWLPASGLDSLKSYILPILCNGLAPLASTVRMTRSSMLEVIRQEYIKTARAKGQRESKVIIRHALGNALIPVITVVGGQFNIVIGGSMITESIFSVPGMGTLLVSAISNRDYPLILGVTLLISVFTSILNLLVDIAYAIADPRVRAGFSGGARKRKKKMKAEAPKAIGGVTS